MLKFFLLEFICDDFIIVYYQWTVKIIFLSKGVISLKTPTTFGTRFKELREERGLNQSDIAKELGVIKQAISNYEKNDREPEFADLVKIANYFNVSIDYLLGRINQR